MANPHSIHTSRRLLVALCVAPALLVAAVALVIGKSVLRSDNEQLLYSSVQSRRERSLASVFPSGKGVELVFVVIGSSKCGASQGSDLARRIISLRDSVRVVAKNHHVEFSSLGVALDYLPDAGIQWLKTLGDFDQIASGQRWLGVGATEFFWRVPSAPTGVPQIIVYSRAIQFDQLGVRVGDRNELVRLVGAPDILGTRAIGDLLTAINAVSM